MEIRRKWTLAIIVMALMLFFIPAATVHADGAVAKIGDTEYSTLDDAIKNAKDNDTIQVLQDCTTDGINLNRNITIQGTSSQPTITFQNKGIAIWGKTLTFKDVKVNMKGIGATPYGEWQWMTICASSNSSLNLDSTVMSMDGSGTASSTHAIYFNGADKLNLSNNASLSIKNYPQDAIEWDGGNTAYNLTLDKSTLDLENNRSGIAGTFSVKAADSTFTVSNNRGNGSNGSDYDFTNTKVTYNGNGSHGLSARNLIVKNSNLTCDNNGMYGVTFFGTMNMDGTSTLEADGNGSKSQGGGIRAAKTASTATIAKGAKVTTDNNKRRGIENHGTFTIEDGVALSVQRNNISSEGSKTYAEGGGVYNVGTMILPNAVICNNHATGAGDDIYSTGDNAKLIFKDAAGSTLDDCKHVNKNWNHAISAWFYDGYRDVKGGQPDARRWKAHGTKIYTVVCKTTDKAISGTVAVKAAHGRPLDVTKKWANDSETNRPTKIKVQLFRDGDAYGDPVELNSATGWTHEWIDLDSIYNWTVDETDVPENYTKTITNTIKEDKTIGEIDDWTITNTYSKKNTPAQKPQKPAKTGDNTNIMIWAIVAGAGILALAVVITMRKKAMQK